MLNSPSITDNILQIYKENPSQHFARLTFSGKSDVTLTYSDLVTNSHQFSSFLSHKGVKRGDVVILLTPYSEELLYAFFGAIFIGAIPSIFSPPSPKTPPPVYEETLKLLLEVCNTRYVVAPDELQRGFEGTGITFFNPKHFFFPEYEKVPLTHPKETDTAFLQHSSGTTGLKKGVALTHAAVIEQLRNYAEAIKIKSDDKIVSWLPLYHDMGLVACLLLPVCTGIPVTMISSFDWVNNPSLLFKEISADKATLTWLPNFAYSFLAGRVKESQLEGVQLSSMRAFINCSEPITEAAQNKFRERFAKQGLRAESLATCYAMAENTFAVTQSSPGVPATKDIVNADVFNEKHQALPAGETCANTRGFVSSGYPIPGTSIRIADNKGTSLPNRYIGEIVVRSNSLFSGYFRRDELTQAVLRDDEYFTGDLGYLANGELFVTGRKKDLIIIGGKNYYPHDIEETVSQVPGVYPGRVAAIGVFNESIGTEELIVLAEKAENYAGTELQLKQAIAQTIVSSLSCSANKIVLLPHMWLLKSSSGKIARNACREKYLQGEV